MIALLLVATVLGPERRPDPDAPVLRLQERTSDIAIDGRLEESDWQDTPLIAQLIQSFPNEGQPSRQRVAVHVVHDDGALYVAARLYDTAPDSVLALLTRRDRNTQSDQFAVFLDPYGDGRTGYRFAVTAAGAQGDSYLYNDDFRDDTWDGVWSSAVQRDSLGWTVEMRIPLAQLRGTTDPERQWGINVGRVIGRYNEVSYLTLRPQQANGFVSRFGTLDGMSRLPRRQRVEFIPYFTTRAEFRPVADGDPFRDGSDLGRGAGADLRLGLGSRFQLDATIFPDFGQVEVDPAVVNLTDVETRFEERRPFFVEGNTIFRFGLGGTNNFMGFGWASPEPAYFRRIGRAPQGRAPAADHVDAPNGVDILGASKLTGKIGQWNVGALAALTQREHARLMIDGTESRSEVEPLAGYGIVRAARDFSSGRHGLGFIATGVERALDDSPLANQVNDQAVVAGVDGWITLDRSRTWVLSGWGATSRVSGTASRITALQQGASHYYQRPDADYVEVDPSATSLAGSYGRLSLNKQSGSVLVNAALGAVTPGFDANDAGFMPRADLINAHVSGGYRWTRRNSWRQSARVQAAAYSSWNFGGDVTARGLWQQTNITFTDFSYVYGGFNTQPEVSDHRATRGGPMMRSPGGIDGFLGWSSDPRKNVQLGANLTAADYGADALSWSASVALTWRPRTNVTLNLVPQLSVSHNPAQYLRTATDPLAEQTFGRRYLFGALEQQTLSASVRLDWIFSPKLSLELYAQPLTSSGAYHGIRELRRPDSFEFLEYGTAGSTIDREAGVVDPDGPGEAPAIAIGQPDFTFTSLRGNAVLRWEYAAGSSLYLVWTQHRSVAAANGEFRPFNAFGRLGDAIDGQNLLMLKVSYWLGR
jgi:hypothetical protein